MITGQAQSDELGFSITSPFKKAAHAVASTSKAAVKYTVVKPTQFAVKATKVTGKAIYQAHAIPTKWLAIKPTEWLAHKAMAPVKSRVQKVVNRRAAKLAWDRRKSKTPTPAEHSEARSWTRNRLLAMSVVVPGAPILAAFAGPDYGSLAGYQLGNYQLGVAPAVVAAAVPVLMAAAAAVISQLNKPSDAPADPTAGGGAGGGAPQDAGPPAPGTVDMTPVQDAADQAKDAVDQATEAATGQKPSVRLPGGMRVQRSHMMIGAVVVGGLVLFMLMKKDGGKGMSGAFRSRRARRRR